MNPRRPSYGDAITDQQLGDWEAEWGPALLEAIQRLHRAGVERKHWPQSRHWDWWYSKTEVIQGMLTHPGFSIMCHGMTQGMMMVDTTTKRCRIEAQKGKNSRLCRVRRECAWELA